MGFTPYQVMGYVTRLRSRFLQLLGMIVFMLLEERTASRSVGSGINADMKPLLHLKDFFAVSTQRPSVRPLDMGLTRLSISTARFYYQTEDVRISSYSRSDRFA